ncbi:MAG: DUF3320 domain-containing protein [Clostridia bacterium]|nr:DUF3320 domain-containing protein [Clostridia bacterium]
MAANKKAKQLLETLDLDGELLNCVSYATYYNRIPLFTSFRVVNNGEEALENVVIQVTGSNKLILPAQIEIDQIPAESSMEVKTPSLLNPKYLAELEDAEDCTVTVTVCCGKTVICDISSQVKAVSMESWSGTSGNAEMLAAFVRPRLSDCQKILAEAGLQLKTWGYSKEFSGYSGNDKNALMYAFASMFSAIRNLNIEREHGGDSTQLIRVGNLADLVPSRKGSPLLMAVYMASCLEAAKFNPVILVGKTKIGVGVWLHESCFNSPLQDDMSVIERYVAAGVNNLAVVDVDDLFAHKNASFATASAHFATLLQQGKFECCIDVKRCRIGGIFSMPIKVGDGKSYEILGDNRYSYDAKPEKLIDADSLSLKRKASKNRNWERRLLDLSLKNNLLNFRYMRDCVHLLLPDLKVFFNKIEGKSTLTLLANQSKIDDALYFGTGNKAKTLSELVSIELNSQIVRSYSGESGLQEAVQTLIRKGKSSREEVGANTIYLAFGFLKWKHSDEKDYKYAPIVLLPVNLKKTKSQGVALELGDDYAVNTTLLEFLKQEFGVDIRGIEDEKLTPVEMLAVFRAKTAHMKGWLVYEDVYLAQFTFAGYAMWRDVRDNMSLYKQNPMIAGLLENTNKFIDNKLSGANEDDAKPTDVLTPLSCDSSQYAAVAESGKGTTFVLHGPPGTGKSQTITNIIANALDSGKRVLFVAEKQAALQVVKKRLNDIGIGEFCLEMHSGKTVDKGEIVRSIENTLSLKSEYDETKFIADGEAIGEYRDTLHQPLYALHKKRGLGVSVYDGIVNYLQNAAAPELVNIESTFYDNLTAKKLAEYENMLLTAQAAARECGGVYRSPFANVNITECDEKIKRSVLYSAEVVVAELQHLKNYLALFLNTFNQKISTFTSKKLNNLVQIVKKLSGGDLNVFFTCDEREFYTFYNANLRYDAGVKNWLNKFKALADVSKFANVIDEEIENCKGDYLASRPLTVIVKRINHLAKTPLKEGEELEWVKAALEIEQDKRKILSYTKLASNFVGITGGINDKKRDDFLAPLYNFHELCGGVFMDYNADAFNSVCAKASDGHLKPLFAGLLGAAKSFTQSCDYFAETVEANKQLISDEDIYDYYYAKCTALIDNIDMLPAWAMYKGTAKKLNDNGLTFITDALESGQISGEKILSAFRKNVYRNFVQKNIPADPRLSGFSATVLDETASNFSQILEEFTKLTRDKIRHDLISRLPGEETEGALALELMSFRRQTKGNPRGLNLRTLLGEIPELLKVVAPCMLMSPFTVSQYLPASLDLFDIVIFDEASQLPTCEAVPSLARAKSAIIVGDPKQMPPTSFFMSVGADEDNPETDDLESVLDDCLALGIPEKHLTWHYRSKHESLIAFSNIMYYSSKLCTFPSPDALDSKVKFRYVENGVYQRGGTKCNKEEAEALVKEVIKRLSDPSARRSSIGVVTFSTPQQVYIEKMLNKAIADKGLEDYAYDREEPLFVKNLENVQGDERDVILFSVCYGPDTLGKISLNFGPLNQFGGWRRLNVAVSRAREEMVVFSSMRYSMIDLSRTTSRGVAGLKAFLEFSEKGRTGIAAPSDEVIINRTGIGKYVAKELSSYGYDCRCDVGVSDFKIDVGVLDPKNKRNFILAVLCDGNKNFSIKDKYVMQVNTLKRNNWNVIRLYSVNFFNNPKREIKKIKDYLDRLTSKENNISGNYKRAYKLAKTAVTAADSNALLSGSMDAELIKTIKSVVTAEEPISEQFLVKRVLAQYGIQKYGSRLEGKVVSLIPACSFKSASLLGATHYYKTDKAVAFERYRVEEGTSVRQMDTDFSPYDVIALVKAILLENVSLYRDELINAVISQIRPLRVTEKYTSFISSCIDEGTSSGMFIRSVSDRISLG